MDIFMCRQDVLTNEIRNVVVELKHPDIRMGSKQLAQVKKYMNVILNEPEFNAGNMIWEFILVGKDFDTRGELEAELESAKGHGERSLAFKTSRYKIYVKKWSEVFNEFDMKHKFINDKLSLERQHLGINGLSATEMVASATFSPAAIVQASTASADLKLS
jgi:hypothetical protein